ncbi:MAG: hypothetical protein U0835_00705 [Isosphaeraceae bacterium]
MAGPAPAASLPAFDFRQPSAVAEWGELHDVARLEATPEGMAVHLDGDDPYFSGPPRDFPPGVPLTMKIRLRPSAGGHLQVFHFDGRHGTSEKRSARVALKGGGWQVRTLFLPPLGPGTRLRLDPPGRRGVCLIESIRFEPKLEIAAPDWPKPTVPAVPADAPAVGSGMLVLRQHPGELGGFTVRMGGRLLATGHNRPLIGYLAPGRVVRWLDVAKLAKVATRFIGLPGIQTVEAALEDPDGGHWRLTQTFGPAGNGAITATATAEVDAPRQVVFLPLLLVLPGNGSFGTLKGQGLFAGVEFLENEPSSSTADLNEEAGALRKVPDSARITFPLMAIQAHGNYVGLTWRQAPEIAALFDSPDRTLKGQGHLMGLIAPGAEGTNRKNGELFPVEPLELSPGKPIEAKAEILVGTGESVLPAVQRYVKPADGVLTVPRRTETGDLQSYIRLAAAGWMDSPLRDGNRFRHAVGGNFPAQPAADAAWMMEQLAALCDDPALAERLRETAAGAAAEVPAEARLHAAVGHVRYPIAPLVLGEASGPAADAVVASLEQARGMAKVLVRRFEPDGSIRYRTHPGGTDYGRTHFCDEANGLTAEPVARLLEAAAFAGDRTLVEEGLRLLRILKRRFPVGVPRGAQTWEIPLHTPDILASASLVKAFALGYELTGEPDLLEAARDWAWSGVPFVYLGHPAGPGAVGPYATTPVLGATNWVAPNWIGLPVQWCGLVYADALFDLARHDPAGPWKVLAQGIAASGIAQSYPLDHPHRGLLPDSFNLMEQSRNPAAINPGTLQPSALRFLAGERGVAYTFRALRTSGLWVHAPGSVEVAEEGENRARLTVRPWSPRASSAVIHGVRPGTSLSIDGQPIAPGANSPHRLLPDRGTLILRLEDGKPAALRLTTGG